VEYLTFVHRKKEIHNIMLLSANLFASFPSQLLLGAILLLAGETGGGRYGLCRIYSYNVQFQPSGRHHHTADDKRYFFACCADAGNEFSCHDQTLQNLRRHEGRSVIFKNYFSFFSIIFAVNEVGGMA